MQGMRLKNLRQEFFLFRWVKKSHLNAWLLHRLYYDYDIDSRGRRGDVFEMPPGQGGDAE